jgi:flagellar hook-length control protein FliK
MAPAAASQDAAASQASPATDVKADGKTTSAMQPDQAASNATVLPMEALAASGNPPPAASDATAARSGKSSEDNVVQPAAETSARGTAAARRKGTAEARADDAAPVAPDGNVKSAALAAAVAETLPAVQAPVQADNADKGKKQSQVAALSGAATPDASAAAGKQPNGNGRGVAAAGTADSAADAASTPATQTRFVQRVARAFEAMGDRTGAVRLRLSPPELGSLKLDINVQNGNMTAHVQADTSAARDLLLQNLPALRDRLLQQNIKIESFQVDLADGGGGGGGTSGQTAQQNQSQPQANLYPAAAARVSQSKASPPAAAAPAARSVQGGNRLNVIV